MVAERSEMSYAYGNLMCFCGDTHCSTCERGTDYLMLGSELCLIMIVYAMQRTSPILLLALPVDYI